MDFKKLIETARRFDASDIHILADMPPCFRVHGEMRPAQAPPLSGEEIRAMAGSITNALQQEKLQRDWELCISLMIGELGRVRVTVYMRAGVPEMAVRLCSQEIGNREVLRLPAVLDELCRRPTGLILICGPTGSGKTTTLNYIINQINCERRGKIITIEDPIEYVHRHKRCIVVQQELLGDVKSFPQALRHALRQDPDVIAIGELRDLDTMYTAIQAAETGHLVIATLHTPGAPESVQRIVNVFPAGQQDEVRYSLGSSLEGVLAQHLLPSLGDHPATGETRRGGPGERPQSQLTAVGTPGRVLACEVMIGTAGVKNIIREGDVHRLYSEIQTGRKVGMQTLDAVLLDLYKEGHITYDCALEHARDPRTLKERIHPVAADR